MHFRNPPRLRSSCAVESATKNEKKEHETKNTWFAEIYVWKLWVKNSLALQKLPEVKSGRATESDLIHKPNNICRSL